MVSRIQDTIHQLVKADKDMVIELDDEVEYILNQVSVSQIIHGSSLVDAVRVIDRKPMRLSVKRIAWAIHGKGVIDYLNAK